QVAYCFGLEQVEQDMCSDEGVRPGPVRRQPQIGIEVELKPVAQHLVAEPRRLGPGSPSGLGRTNPGSRGELGEEAPLKFRMVSGIEVGGAVPSNEGLDC